MVASCDWGATPKLNDAGCGCPIWGLAGAGCGAGFENWKIEPWNPVFCGIGLAWVVSDVKGLLSIFELKLKDEVLGAVKVLFVLKAGNVEFDCPEVLLFWPNVKPFELAELD